MSCKHVGHTVQFPAFYCYFVGHMLENILYFRAHYLNIVLCGGSWCDAHSHRAATPWKAPAIGHVSGDGRGHPIGTRVRGKRTHCATCRGASSGLSSFCPQFSRNSHATSMQHFANRADNNGKSVINSSRSCFVSLHQTAGAWFARNCFP